MTLQQGSDSVARTVDSGATADRSDTVRIFALRAIRRGISAITVTPTSAGDNGRALFHEVHEGPGPSSNPRAGSRLDQEPARHIEGDNTIGPRLVTLYPSAARRAGAGPSPRSVRKSRSSLVANHCDDVHSDVGIRPGSCWADREDRAVTLNGKVAMVTGSTSGIGRASALALAARGAHVLVIGRDAQRGAGVVEEITEKGGGAEFHQTTLSDVGSARQLAAWATETSGSHVDILVNNVGTAVVGPTESATEAEFDETFSLNVKVPFFLVAALAPAMAERGWGSIVNMSTMVAGFGQPGMAIYGASRAALELLTKSWAAELGREVYGSMLWLRVPSARL